MEPLFTLAATELRWLLDQLLRTEADFDAFISDYFPDVKRRFASDMDRVAKTNLLLEGVERGVLSGRLRTIYPDAFAFILMIEKGHDVGRQFPLPNSGQLSIGRALEADIRLPETETQISRRHATLTIKGTEVVVKKQGKGPIFIEGREVTTWSRVYPGEGIEIHRTVLRLHAGHAGHAGSVLSQALAATLPPTHVADLGPLPERESMPAARDSAFRIFWILADRLVATGRIDEADRMVSRRLAELRKAAAAGQRFDLDTMYEWLDRVHKLARAGRRADWFGWIFEFAGLYRYRIEPPLLDELCDSAVAIRPAIGEQLTAYAQVIGDPGLATRLEALRQKL